MPPIRSKYAQYAPNSTNLAANWASLVAAATSVAIAPGACAALAPSWLRNPPIVRAWRPSLLVGFNGHARLAVLPRLRGRRPASVRTRALVEGLFAQAISLFVFRQPTTAREGTGIVLIVIGVALLLWVY